jgi:hypothetical protein
MHSEITRIELAQRQTAALPRCWVGDLTRRYGQVLFARIEVGQWNGIKGNQQPWSEVGGEK